MRFVFLGSPPFATPVLERLLASRHEGLGLVTPPDRARGRGRSVKVSPLVELAKGAGLEVLQPEDPHDEACMGALRELGAEVHVVASYGVLMKEALLELPPQGSLNVHASLLPRHRGASPIQASILAGDAETGVSVQRMVLALDAGDVLHEIRTEIGEREVAGELFERLAELGGQVAVESLDLMEAGDARFVPQDEGLATYARKLKKRAGRIRWAKGVVDVDRRIRAMTPWPGAQTTDPKGKQIFVRSARPVEFDVAGAGPGSILETSPRLVVATGEGALELEVLQAAGKRPLSAEEFLRGARWSVGESLGGA